MQSYKTLFGLSKIDASSIIANTLSIDSLTLPTGAMNGFVLTSDNVGHASWQDPTISIILSGDVSGPLGANVVDFVGTSSALDIHNAVLDVQAATDLNTISTIVKRDIFGNFVATSITSDLVGNVTGNVLGDLTGDVTGNLTGNVLGDLTGNVLGNLTGNVTGNVSGSSSSFTGLLLGDITGTQSATVVSLINGVSATLNADINSTQTFTNKTLTGISNNIDANTLRNGSTWAMSLSGSAPATNDVLMYNGTNAVWSAPTVSSVTMGGNVTGLSSSCTVIGAAGNFNVVGRTTTAGETNSLGLNFTTSNIKMLALTDLGVTTTLTEHTYDGLGSASNILRYQAKATTTNHTFYSATSSSTSDTLMIIGGNGIVTIPKILTMGQTGTRKEIVLWEAGTPTDVNSHLFAGFGLGSAQMLYQVNDVSASHKFYAATGVSTSNLLLDINGNGNVYVPRILSMGNSGNRKEIVLWEGGSATDVNAHHFAGFGLGASQMLYQIDNTAASHNFYAATSSTSSNLLLNIGGNGVVNIPGNLNLATSGGTPSNLNYYEEYTLSTGFSGPITISPINLYITRIGRIVHMVSETVTSAVATAIVSHWTSTTAIPSRFRGYGSTLIKATNIYSQTTAFLIVRPDNGLIEITLYPSPLNWDGGVGFYNFSVTWRV